MIEAFVLLTPLVVLPIVLLFVFVGCPIPGFNVGSTIFIEYAGGLVGVVQNFEWFFEISGCLASDKACYYRGGNRNSAIRVSGIERILDGAGTWEVATGVACSHRVCGWFGSPSLFKTNRKT